MVYCSKCETISLILDNIRRLVVWLPEPYEWESDLHRLNTTKGLAVSFCVNGQTTSYTYDAQGRLSSWQNQPDSPNQIVNYLYDDTGNRVAMQSTVNGTKTLTAYIGSILDGSWVISAKRF